MRFSDLIFWRKAPIGDLPTLAEFIDEQAAFLVQKGIYEYSRARAGHYAKVLFSEEEFLRALEHSRWAAYPLGLAMVGEIAAGVLAPQADGEQARRLEGLNAIVLSVFDRYAVPASFEPQTWNEARDELARRLQLIGLHPPKRAKDIPAPYARVYWDLMPIAKEIRTADFPTTHNYLKVTLCNVHDRLTERADVPRLVSALADGAQRLTPATAS
jgi:hypothetical protein